MRTGTLRAHFELEESKSIARSLDPFVASKPVLARVNTLGSIMLVFPTTADWGMSAVMAFQVRI